MLARCVLLALLGASSVKAHSWVACTDYRVANPTEGPMGPSNPDPARRLYDDSKCHAYARDWQSVASFFGNDLGYNYQMATGAPVCRNARTSNDYTTEYPMASYKPGQTVCLAYPAKNHAAAPCTNAFIPDTKLAIYRSGVNPTTDPDWPTFEQNSLPHHNGVHQDGVMDYKGFQNCPDFCGAAGTSYATCSVCFDLESDLAPGKYTFLWYWEFNAGDAPYTSCWEAQVGGASVEPGPSPTPTAPKPTPKEPTPTPKAPTPKAPVPVPTVPAPAPPTPSANGGGRCFCPCSCKSGCWHKCGCSAAGAQRKDPFTGAVPLPAPAPTPTEPNPTPNSGGCSDHWEQCDGLLWTGPKCCKGDKMKCRYQNDYYSQCLY